MLELIILLFGFDRADEDFTTIKILVHGFFFFFFFFFFKDCVIKLRNYSTVFLYYPNIFHPIHISLSS